MTAEFDLNEFLKQDGNKEVQVTPDRKLVFAAEKTEDGVVSGPRRIYSRIFVLERAIRTAHEFVALSPVRMEKELDESLMKEEEEQIQTVRLELAWLRGDQETINQILGR